MPNIPADKRKVAGKVPTMYRKTKTTKVADPLSDRKIDRTPIPTRPPFMDGRKEI